MSERIVFKSIGNSQIGYEYSYQGYEYGRNHGLADHARQFDTFGDGMVQHSPAYAVSPDNARDYLLSLAYYLGSHLDEADLSSWPGKHDSRDFEFFRNLKYRADKVQYFSRESNKVSTAESKRHDKRWETVPTWADGSAEATARFMTKSYFEPLHSLALRLEIRDWYWKGFHTSIWIESVPGFEGDFNSLRDIADAFTTVDYLVQAHNLQKRAASQMSGYIKNLEDLAKKEAETV